MPATGYGFAPAGLVYRAVPTDSIAAAATPLADSILARDRGPTPDSWTRRLASTYWFMRGEYLAATGDWAAAKPAYQTAATVAYDSRTTQFNVAVIYLRHNELWNSLERLQAALAIDPASGPPHAMAAEVLRRLGRMGEAEQMHARARALEGNP